MYLEKIELQGFKSFARRTVVQFASENGKNHNLTVIVGPNGSGKSNIADAVRWVLGEQSSKTLRGKKSEDVIFAGSATKGKLGMAEVSLFLNNEDKKAPIDYTQLVITRRLYRDGVSEYLINGTKVRLVDITILLARARFGQRAYSVVGQGMVDAFLNTTPAERKEFFDEATGVRVFQIKKHEAALKFRAAEQNLEQVETLLAEIEPRLKSLTRQVKKLQQRAAVEGELRGLQTRYYARAWHSLRTLLAEVNGRVVTFENNQRAVQRELAASEAELATREQNQYQTARRSELQSEQRVLQTQRNRSGQRLAEVRAHKNVALERSGKTDVAWLMSKADELRAALDASRRAAVAEEGAESQAAIRAAAVRREQEELDAQLSRARREVIGFHSEESEDAQETLAKIKRVSEELFALNDEVYRLLESGDLAAVKTAFGALHAKIKELKTTAIPPSVTDSAEELQRLQTELIRLEEEKNALTQRYIEAQGEWTRAGQAMEVRRAQQSALQGELAGIEKKLAQADATPADTQKDLVREEEELVREVDAIDEKIAAVERALAEIEAAEARVREEIMGLQKKAHAAQARYNDTARELNTAQVEKARLETRLEDLENEIRRETDALRAAVDCQDYELAEDDDAARERIQKLKRQLELIGGIDPETQQEYEETKTRYEFLHEQATDLRKALTSLKKVIVELEEKIQETFNRAFTEIARQFEAYFKILFDGGTAKLEKVMEEEKKEEEGEEESKNEEEILEVEDKKTGPVLRKKKEVLAGIDVMASPPNKKVKHISMLSGGERALTSIALIAAIIAVNPSPFVMLDEVDAALDEANSQRLAKILEDLSKRTQFIAITHNRTIMYKADVIYGVTMGEDGISKLLSVKVEDVKAARQ